MNSNVTSAVLRLRKDDGDDDDDNDYDAGFPTLPF